MVKNPTLRIPIFKIIEIYLTNKLDQFRIFDTWMYNNEAEMAYIRIWRLYYYVDFFLIVVSPVTHSGKPKNITFAPFEKEIDKFKDKIRIIKVPKNTCYREIYKKKTKSWCREKSQRDYAIIAAKEMFNLTTSDIFLVSDADEIFTREAVTYIRQHPPSNLYFVKGSLYFPNYYHYVGKWDVGFVCRYYPSCPHISILREAAHKNKPIYYPNILKSDINFITHCSYCFKDLEQYKNKIKSFAHQEFNKPPYITNDWIFMSHYCRIKIPCDSAGYDIEIKNLSQLIPNDPRLYFLIDRSFEYPLNLTNYTSNDLKSLCKNNNLNRTPLINDFAF